MRSSHYVLALLALGVSVAACSAEAPEPERHGTFQMPLVSVGTSGAQYQLSGSFEITGPTSQTVDASGTQSSIDVTLQVGSYNVALASGWTLSRIENGMPVVVQATLVSPTPQPFTIQENAITEVAFAFQTQGDSVVFGNGTLTLTFDVNDELAEATCNDGLDNDSDNLADCADPDCAQSTTCVTENNCTDGIDNDSDMLVDCADSDCAGSPDCAAPACGDGDAEVGELCFGPREQLDAPIPGGVTHLASADFNGDGRVDLALGSAPGAAARVMMNNGASFTPGPVFGTAPVRAVLTGDFNANMAPDVAIVTTNDVRVFSVDAAGGLVPIGGFQAPLNQAVAAQAGDLNADGRVDLVVVSDFQIAVLRNLGAGFAPPIAFGLPGPTAAVALADFNGDTRLDAAVARRSPGEVHLFNGDGAGGLIQTGVVVPVGTDLASLAAADVVAGGFADLVAGAANAGQAFTLRNVGATFTPMPFPAAPFSSIALVNVDYDNRLDVLGASSLQSMYGAWLGDGMGQFIQALSFPAPGLGQIIGPDVNGDGFSDIVVGTSAPSALQIVRSNP